jgi:hypothetical protein
MSPELVISNLVDMVADRVVAVYKTKALLSPVS